jgi:HemY protein
MTSVVHPSAGPPGNPAPGSGPDRGHWPRWWRWLAASLVLVLALVATPAAMIWRAHALLARVQAGLPAPPDLTGKPRELAELLAKAQAKTMSRQELLEGAAELGRLYHANNYPREAEACWKLLRAVQPREARWCYYLADLRAKDGDYDGMTELVAQTTELAPDYSPAWLRLADLRLKYGRLEEAERAYEKRLALLPSDRYARLGLIRVALQQGRRDQARDFVERLVSDAPEFPTAHNLYAEMLLADGDSAKAGRERWLGREAGRFREADDPWLDELNDRCYDYDRLCLLGSIEAQTKQREHARHYFERAIAVRPTAPQAYELMGSMDVDAGDPAKARATLELELRRLTPDQPSVACYLDLAHAFRLLQQPVEAVRVVRLGMERLGAGFELYDALGVALGDLGKGDEAVEALRNAVARNPRDANANYNLAIALVNVRRLDEAMDALHRSLILRPTFPESLALLAQIEIDSGRWRSATKYIQPLYESHPELPQARQLMATWHLLSGIDAEKQRDLAGAEQHYRDGLAVIENLAELQVRLGTLYLIEGRFADAVAPLEAYHRLRPDNPQAYLYLGQAYAATGRRDDARRILTEGADLADRTGNAATAQHCREILQHL